MKIYNIPTENFKLDGGAMFGVIPKSLWIKKYPCDENNLCNAANRCMLVIDGERKILVDNGHGDKQDEKFFSHKYLNGDDTLLKSLDKIGVSTDEITDVVLTHLHADHCGGGVRYNEDKTGFEMVFKNATYWASKQQWESAINPNKREKAAYPKENLMPMMESGQLKLIEEDRELFPNFYVKISDGHTMGMIIPFVKYNDRTLVFTTDLIPSAAHIPLPYLSSYEILPLTAIQEKEDLLNEAADNKYVFFFQHDLYNECCTVARTEKGIVLDKTFTLQSFVDGEVL